MALTPHITDENREEVLRNIARLKKENTAQAKDKLKELHNIDADGKQKVVTPSSSTTSANAKG